MLSHNTIGIIAIVIGFAGYAPYLYDMFRGKTKPHIFSWVIWAILEFICFGIQVKNGVGAGLWVTFFSAAIASIVALYAFKYSKLTITRIDWLCFVGACVALVFWLVLDEPLVASISLVLTDLLAFIPTYRKTWTMPDDETLYEYGFASLKFVVAFFAFNSFSLDAIMYPAYLVVSNAGFVLYALSRKKIIKNRP